MNRVENRLSSIEHTLGHMYATAGDDRATLDTLARRVDRIERRLEFGVKRLTRRSYGASRLVPMENGDKVGSDGVRPCNVTWCEQGS